MKTFLATAALAGALALSGCAVMTPGTAPGTSSTARQGLSQQEVHFLSQAAHAGHAEVEAGRLAQARAANPQVRAFAARMVQDHARGNAELAKLAAARRLELPQAPSRAQQSRLRALSTLSGEAFDRAYVDQMGVMAHETAISLYRLGAANAQDPEVKAFATRTLPTLTLHLDMAKQFRAGMGR